ncbi:MAG TPA: TonB-dependent receptor [Bryobacteraceae bacterium]|nr:TonB-dependent receptor [Bryobacteraceae bacterium]
MRNRVFLSVVILLAAALLVWGQAETGQIVGSVKDPSGASVPKATVTVKSATTGSVRTEATDANGNFTFANLRPDDYDVTVDAQGFMSLKRRVTVAVGAKVGLDLTIQVGSVATTVEVSESANAAITVNTETQTLSQVLNTTSLTELPTITRNPYDLVMTAGTVSEDDPSGRGVGVSINGLRSAGTNVLLDGVANNDEFDATVGQTVPLDSVQEIGIITNNFTAEYGRADAGVINVTTKSGTNNFHGTAYEFNRVSALGSTGFNNDAYGLTKSPYTRNQFGYSIGGPVKKNKLFFFNNTEWTRVRSSANIQALVPDPALISASAAATQQVFSTYGKLASNVQVLQTFNRQQLTALGADPCDGSAKGGGCQSYSATAPMFDLVNYSVPSNSGAGTPQNTYNTVGRVDYNLSDRTQIYGRYALYSENDFAGSIANSPYSGYNTGQTIFDNSLIVSLTHTFSARFVSQSKLDFNRFNTDQPLSSTGVVPVYYLGSAENATSIGPYDVTLPGYNPLTPGSGIPFGGPQNFGQAYQDFSFTKGKHELRFGGSVTYLRDNRTFGAYEEGQQILGNTVGKGLDNFLAGQVYEFQGAIYPQDKYPCINSVQTPACTVTLPLGPPTFERSNRYHEGAAYFQDSWKVAPRLTLNLGVRWEYFGVQHNVNAELDSNFYPSSNSNPYEAIAQGVVEPAPSSPIGELWTPSKKNFSPRVGFAWDVFGDGKTAIRAGYGIGYERNFGNVTYNVLFNPPNYAVVDLIAGSNVPSIPLNTSNFGPLGGSSGSAALPPSELRAIQPNIGQAYAHLVSASIEHQFSSTHLEIDYSGSIGENLYDIAGENIPGMGNLYLGVPCTAGDTLTGGPNPCEAPLNTQYGGINRRGSAGISNYNAMNIRYDIQNIHHSGLTLRMNYTWSHAQDELSDTFSSSFNQFNLGYTDIFNPKVDYGNAEFDNRHRIAISGIWEVPFAHHMRGFAAKLLDGWEFAPIFTARTGAPYTIYDITNDNYLYTRVAANQAIPVNGNLPRVNAGSNTFNVFDFSKINVDESYLNPITGDADFGPWPANFTGRDYFHAPGTWNLNLGMYKNTRITERATMQLRLEAYNADNHANFGINTGSAYIYGGSGFITGSYSGNRNIQLAAKVIF